MNNLQSTIIHSNNLLDSNLQTKNKKLFQNLKNLFLNFANKITNKNSTPTNSENLVKDSKVEKLDTSFNEENANKRKKKGRWIPTPLILVFGILILLTIVTWIPHESWWDTSGVLWDETTGYYYIDTDMSGGLTTNPDGTGDEILGYSPVPDLPGFVPPTSGAFGLADFATTFFYGFMQALWLIIYLFIVGALIEIVLHTKAIDSGIGSLLGKMKDKELILIPILFIMFSAFGGFLGAQEGILAIYTIMVPFMLLAGFNSMTAIGIMMIGTATGMAASPTNPFSTQIAVDIANDSFVDMGVITAGETEYSLNNTLSASMITWSIFTALGATFMTWYAGRKRKQKINGKQKSYDLQAEEWSKTNHETLEVIPFNWRRTTTLIIFFSAFLMQILLTIPWSFSIDAFAESIWWLTTSNMGGIGTFVIAIIAILGVNKINMKDATDLILSGAKSMLNLTLVIGLARAIALTLTYSGFSFLIVNGIASSTQTWGPGAFMLMMFITFLIIGFIVPSTSAAATLIFPIVAPIVITMGLNTGASDQWMFSMMTSMILLFTIALGLINMVSPIQAVVLGSCAQSGVSYKNMLKDFAPYTIGIFCFTIFVLIPSMASMV